MMKQTIFCFAILLASLSCAQEKSIDTNGILSNGCFENIEAARQYLPKAFVDTLLNDEKKQIINNAESIGLNLRKNKSLSSSPCNSTSKDLSIYSMPININDPKYVGGRLDIYFESEQLISAKFFLIELP